jgi:hypothetical protein
LHENLIIIFLFNYFLLILFYFYFLKNFYKIYKKYYNKKITNLLTIIGGGRKIRDIEMERKLVFWYRNNHNKNGKKVTVKQFKKMALHYSSCDGFRASKGWLEKFKKRHNISFKI